MSNGSAAELPVGWATATLPECIGQGGIFSDGDWVESKDQDPVGSIRLTQLADVGVGRFLDRSSRYMTTEAAARLRCTFLETGDVLVARMPDPLGRACVFPGSPMPCVTVVDVCIVRPSKQNVEPRWLMWAINAPQFQVQVDALQSGTTRKRISRRNLATIRLPVPPLAEQRRIVAAIETQFTRLDAAVVALERARARLKRYRSAVLADACAGRLSSRRTHSRSHKDGVSPPSNWKQVTVEQLGVTSEQTVLTGPFGSTMGSADFVASGIPVLTIGCLTDAGIRMDKAVFVSPSKANQLTRYRVESGDVLFSRMASVGRVGLVTPDLNGSIINYHIMRLRLSRDRIVPEYFLAFVRGSRIVADYVRKVNHGATRDGINTRQLLQMPIWLPPLSEQEEIVQEIARRMSIVEETQASISDNRRRAERLRQSILRKAFAGQLVAQDPTDEPASVLLERIRMERATQLSTKGSARVRSRERQPQLL